MTKRIFISVANTEHEAFRGLLRDELTRTRFFDVVVQTDFAHTANDTLRKLESEIASCDLLLHIVGNEPGSRAKPGAVEDFFSQTDRGTFLAKVPRARVLLGDFSLLTYFQWEPWLALHRDIDLLVYAEPGHDTPDFPQRDHLETLRTARRHAETLPDAERRCARIVVDVCHHFGIIPDRPEQRIAATKLVTRHTADELHGRERELALLDVAWAERDMVNVQCVIAWGGVGKTALLAHWVQTRFRNRGWKDDEGRPDPLIYFDWTFYDQGTRSSDATQAGAASLGTFFVEALRHFGDPEPDKPEDKVQRLAALVQANRGLLVLDGLEPLQYPHNHPQAGQITDPDLAQFLRLIAQKNPGLCLVSSREVLSDLGGHLTNNAPHHDLEDLPTEAAIALLRKLQITGSDRELAQAADDYQHHALSLILLGRFLSTARGGDIRRRDTVSFEKADNRRTAQTRSAWHVLETYEQWLAGPDGNPTDLQALRLVGLFDRPARPDCLEALRQAPAIPGVTDHLVSLDHDDWNAVLHRLNEAHLVQLKFPPRDAGSYAPYPEARSVPVDAHPLIREYFARQLGDKESTGFKAAHSRLFDHLCETTEHQPDTLDGLQPLYQAVVHGCLAGRQPEARNKVYRDRILRGTGNDGYFSTRKLGARGADLGALAAFFETPWSRLSKNLTKPNHAWILSEAASRLRSVGRLTEALEPMQIALEMAVRNEHWLNASICAGNLSGLKVSLGELTSAIADARCAIDFADRIVPPNHSQRMSKRTTAADALHQSGQREEAHRLFERAETLQRESHPQFELSYSLSGFRYCDLLLGPAERSAWRPPQSRIRNLNSEINSVLANAERRATRALERAGQRGTIDAAAQGHLTMARVSLYRASLEPRHSSSFILHHSAAAVAALRKANAFDHLPGALLTAAASHHLVDDPDTARALLDEAQQIAERGPMPLYLADVHLHRARLFRSRAELARAKALIEKHGYWRRREELADAEAASTKWP